MMRNATLDIHPLTEAVGAEILNIDLAAPQSEQTWLEIGQAFADHGVIFFRDQHLTPDQQIAFAEHFGTIAKSSVIARVPGYENVEEIRKEPEQTTNFGGGWHTDQSFRQHPTRGTCLLAREVPDFGGDTAFISMAKAYEALSDGLKRTLEGLRALHSGAGFIKRHGMDSRVVAGEMDNFDPAAKQAIHPVVIRMPESGRKVLFVNPSKTIGFEGWTEEESAPLLDYLYRHAQKPEFGCRFRWREGSMAFWDNYQTWHMALNDYDGNRRLMHRITVEMAPFG